MAAMDPECKFPPEIDRLWDALTRRGMHYDRESMEYDEPDMVLVNQHRASLAHMLDKAGWVPRADAEALAHAASAVLGNASRTKQMDLAAALTVYLAKHPWSDL